jgi:hypothetical protein
MTDSFLATKAQERGVRTLKSGMLLQVVSTGDGELSPEVDSVCDVVYEGRFSDGTVFDTSGEGPSTFSPDAVIPAWTLALQMMAEGDKWTIYVPAELGYGKKATKGIPANSTLVFTMELLKVQIGGKPADKARQLLQKNVVSGKSFKQRVTAMYEAYCPDKLPTVDATCAKFEATESTKAKLMAALIAKYGEEPE